MATSKIALRVIDCIALTIAFLFPIGLIGAAIIQGLFTALHVMVDTLDKMLSNRDDRIILAVVAISAIWCWIRWKALNSRG